MTSQASTSSSARSSVTPSTATSHDELAAEDVPNIIDPNRWFFEKDKLEQTPSRKAGVDPDKELAYRQQSANFIQDMGQRLQVNQLCINTAIVYMHRFFMFHSFTQFNRNHVSTASIFLAAKVEEQPRKLEHVIKVAHFCLNRDNLPPIDVKSEAYLEQTSELVITENILLQTLGFDVAIDHPHTHVVKCCQLVRASKDLAQTSYFMATNSLHLTTMCLQYKPTVVACVCIHLTCKWSSWEIPRSKEGRDWFWYVDDSVTMDQLEKLTTEFLAIFDKSPSRLKKKILSLNQGGGSGSTLSLSSFPTFNMDTHRPATPHSLLGKRPSSPSSVSPDQAQVHNKSTKLVNGGLGHHPSSKSSQSHGSSTIPPSSSSVSKHPSHYSSVPKGIPSTHHSAKATVAPIQHGKPPSHHSSGQQQFPPHGTSSSSNRPISHSHVPGGHQSSHAPIPGRPPSSSSKPPSSNYPPSFHSSSSGSSSHGMVGHPSKSQPPHTTQPSKLPYNYNVKSQQQQQQPLLPPPSQPSGQGSLQGKSSTSMNLPLQPHPNKYPSQLPPPLFNQVKKSYPEPSRRENPPTGGFNGKLDNLDEVNRRSIKTDNSQLPSRSIPTVRPSLNPNHFHNIEFGQQPTSNVGRGAAGGSDMNFPKIESDVSGNGHTTTTTTSTTTSTTTISQGLLQAGSSDPLSMLMTSQPVSLTTPLTSNSSSHTSLHSPPKRPLAVEEVTTGEEPPQKKSKKSKKEKHKHKDKEKYDDKKKDSSKKHKDKSKDKGSGKDEKKHKQKHRDKEKDKSKDKLKIPTSEIPAAAVVAPPGLSADMSRNRIKLTISGSDLDQTIIQGGESSQHEKSKSKHSSKKYTSMSKTSSSSSSSAVNTPTAPSLKLKIRTVRPSQ